MRYEKLSASMAALIEEFEVQGVANMTASARAVPLAMDDAAAPPTVFAYVRCSANASIEQVPGVNMHAKSGNVRTALVSLDGVDNLSEREDVWRISPAVQLKPLNDVAAQKTGLPTYRSRTKHTGAGVIVGIVDTGVDTSHPAFANRIDSIWDQTISGIGWASTKYGTVLKGPAMIASSDTNGHGTHVAGIAAGKHATFGGVASEARIVVVKTNFSNTGIGDGIRYVFGIADELNLPAVVNLSLGGHHDAHDGSDDLSEMINERSGGGRIVVVAAGNEGGDPIHAAAIISPGDTAEIAFIVPPNSLPGGAPFVRLNGWYGKDSLLEISVRTSTGEDTPFQPVIQAGPPSRTYNLTGAVIRLTTPPPTATPNGDHHFLAELQPGGSTGLVQGGTWRLRVMNTGASEARVDVWSIVPEGSRDVAFTTPHNSSDMKIGSPGAAAQAITVASFTSRNTWTDSTGANRAVGLTLDTISDFSSLGPLRDGTRKPDVAAPGAMIVSCLSSKSKPAASNIVGSGLRVNAGTSMACPYITGLAALLLEGDHSLDAAAIKTRLRLNSRIPGVATNTFDPRWGFGMIDAGSL